MNMSPIARATAVIVCFALASLPALALGTKDHKPSSQTAPSAAHKATRKATGKPAADKSAGKKAPAAVAKAYAAMPADERLAIQADLAWTGYYEGLPGGDFDDERAVDAVKSFQRANKGKETGTLGDDERAHLAAAAEPHRLAVGWKLIEDPATGARFGLPEKLVSPIGPSPTGSRWISGHGQIQVDDFRLGEANLPALFDAEKKTPRGRQVEASALAAESFVISGTQGLKNFVVRAEANGSEVRGITILYDQATAGIMASIAIAMANSFAGFPDPTAAPPAGQERAVEYGTAIVADKSGALITARRATADCQAITVPGFGHAVRIAADEADDLALIRLFGARDLVPAALAGDSQGDDLVLVGVADPAAQGGGAAVSRTAAHLNGQGIEPAPKPGFSGAAAVDPQGRFVGMVVLKSQSAAGNIPATQSASLVPAAAVRAFLAAHGITPASGRDAIDRSILRVICVRK
jgi:trypsin-like peptidase/putative peptidoglycan binding protein